MSSLSCLASYGSDSDSGSGNSGDDDGIDIQRAGMLTKNDSIRVSQKTKKRGREGREKKKTKKTKKTKKKKRRQRGELYCKGDSGTLNFGEKSLKRARAKTAPPPPPPASLFLSASSYPSSSSSSATAAAAASSSSSSSPSPSPLPSPSPSLSQSCIHQGRVRTVEHTEGNWATHVHIAIPPPVLYHQYVHNLERNDHATDVDAGDNDAEQENKWSAMVARVCHNLCQTSSSSSRSSQQSGKIHLQFAGEMGEAGAPEKPLTPLHLSLSQTVYLRYHQIQPFLSLLQQELSALRGSCLDAFRLCISSSLRSYTNDNDTRRFWALEVQEPDSRACLLLLVRAVDAVMRKFKLPIYYDPPSFHVSVAWRNVHSVCTEKDDHISRDLGGSRSTDTEQTVSSVSFAVNKVHVKCGNRTYAIPLQ